ncbi:MAG TPA: hypothetical protein VKD69_04665, partial [Vicinamibacterales bacterium]|nr:hypothetical protein [Vicinamibacterales bacterium]
MFARERAKRWLEWIRRDLVRTVYVAVASLLLIGACAAWQPIGGNLYDLRGTLRIAFAGVQLAGLWVITRAVARIDPLELAG